MNLMAIIGILLVPVVIYIVYYFMNKKKDTGNKSAEILFFYTDWCPHCTSAKPEWNAFKNSTTSVNGYKITYTEINCTKETPESERMMEQYKVEGFPTIKLLANGRVIDFDAKTTEQNLKTFVDEALN